jgi:polyvinyl alcohol dehydrogenase (cytochrome)
VVISAGKSGIVVGLDPDTGQVLWQTSVGRHDHDTGDLHGSTVVYPGTYGGIETPPATADGVVYVATLNAPSTLKPDEVAYVGSDLGTAPGDVVAIDAATGKVQWSQEVPGDPLGGATVVNDLVLTATLQGKVVALARNDGHIVWTYDAPGGINGWLSAVGDTLYIPVGNAKPSQLIALRLPK